MAVATPALTRVKIGEFSRCILLSVLMLMGRSMKTLFGALAVALCCLSNPVLAQAPAYDPSTGELRLTPVRVGDVSYVATLKDVGGLTFKLVSAVEQPEPPPACARYDASNATLTLLTVKVGQASYRATLVNLGDYTFRVTMATEDDALCITSQPSFRVAAAGGNADFEIGAAGTDLQFQWQRSNDNGMSYLDIAGANSPSYTLTGVGPADDRSHFRVVVAGRTAAAISDVARLRVGLQTRRIAAGYGHVIARKADGTLMAWGNNSEGQLGDGTTINRHSPVPVKDVTGVVSVAANQYFSLALKNDGTVWAWGTDFSGQIGDAMSGGSRLTPVQATGLTRIVAIAAGGSFGLALDDDGTVFSWGANNLGQLGSGAMGGVRQTAAPALNLASVAKIVAGEFTAYAIKADGSLWGWGYNSSSNRVLAGTSVSAVATPVQMALPGGAHATDASIGDSHQLVRATNGALLGWGSNDGKIGDGTKLFRATPVDVMLTGTARVFAACLQHSLGATEPNGAAFAWGMNTAGELGNGQTTGTVLTPQPIPGLANVNEFACRTNASPFNVATTTNGQVWTWGHNEVGQLGDGTTTLRTSPVVVPGLTLN